MDVLPEDPASSQDKELDTKWRSRLYTVDESSVPPEGSTPNSGPPHYIAPPPTCKPYPPTPKDGR